MCLYTLSIPVTTDNPYFQFIPLSFHPLLLYLSYSHRQNLPFHSLSERLSTVTSLPEWFPSLVYEVSSFLFRVFCRVRLQDPSFLESCKLLPCRSHRPRWLVSPVIRLSIHHPFTRPVRGPGAPVRVSKCLNRDEHNPPVPTPDSFPHTTRR